MLFNKKIIIISIIVTMITITFISYLNGIRIRYTSKCKQYNAELLEMMN